MLLAKSVLCGLYDIVEVICLISVLTAVFGLKERRRSITIFMSVICLLTSVGGALWTYFGTFSEDSLLDPETMTMLLPPLFVFAILKTKGQFWKSLGAIALVISSSEALLGFIGFIFKNDARSVEWVVVDNTATIIGYTAITVAILIANKMSNFSLIKNVYETVPKWLLPVWFILNFTLFFPSKLGSYPVVAVEDDSYQQVNRIRGFIYPDSVKRINFPNFVVNNYELRRVVIYNKECLVRYSISDSYFCKDYDSIIWGYKGSTAEKFAEEYNKKFINIDYVNQDGIYDYCVNNNEATILLVPGDTSGEIEIPSQIQGFPVTEIDDAAFKRTDIIKVTIPGSVNRIGNQAFFCFDLKDISLSEGLKTIGDRAFCSNSIKNIELPESL